MAFAGGDKILHAAKNRYSRKQIKEWLTGQDAHTIHKPVLFEVEKILAGKVLRRNFSSNGSTIHQNLTSGF